MTLVLTLMSVFTAGMKYMQAKLPPPPPNRLATSSADFLLQASGERVNWYSYSDTAFAEARRQDKPILLAVGAPYSQFGRDLDRYVLSAKEVVNYLNRNFICVRVDLMEQPDWLNNYLPISRFQSMENGPAQLFFTSGLQFWILDSEGRMYDLIARVAASQKVDRTQMVQILSNARDQFDQIRKGKNPGPEPGSTQKHDLEILERRVAELPNVPALLSKLKAQMDPVYGGFPSSGLQVPMPQALRLLLLTGQLTAFDRAASPMLRSPIFDLLDGGFFRESKTIDWMAVDYDKLAIINAELAQDFAEAFAMTHNPAYKFAAEKTMNSLTGEFTHAGDIAGCRVGDDIPMYRSLRSSFSPKRLKDVFPDADEREWVTKTLALDPRINRQCVPVFNGDLSPDFQSRLAPVLEKLRSAAPESPKFAGRGYASINAGVLARLIPTARLLGNSAKLEEVLELFDGIDRFKSHDDIVHRVDSTLPEGNFLVDYLTYSDASLQAFLATGRMSYFENGLAVLRRAKFLFLGDVPGEYFLAKRDADQLGPQDANAPEVIDNVGESCTAKMMRLCQAYGRLLDGGKERESGVVFGQAAFASSAQFGSICNEIGIHCSGFFCSAAILQDDTYAVAVGPNCQRLSDQLFRLAPERFTLEALGPVHPDLQKRPPGIYVVKGASVTGPFSPEKAASIMSPTLQAG